MAANNEHPSEVNSASKLFAWAADNIKNLAGLLFALLYFKYAIEKLVDKELTLQVVFLGLVPLTAIFFVYGNYLPKRRARLERMRPKKLSGPSHLDYFTTAPRGEKDAALFADRYERFVDWAKEPASPVLSLTGESGSGKSSVIRAVLMPWLKEYGVRIMLIRSHDDPLKQMAEALGVEVGAQENMADALANAIHTREAAQPGGEKHLIIIDQFEEFFLIADEAKKVAALAARKRQDALKHLLHELLRMPPKQTAILLCYRSDHQQLIDRLELPMRIEGRNWMEVVPLPFDLAQQFIKSCPGLEIPEERMELVLKEAARQEGSNKVMKPIVANILGIVLQRMATHPTDWKREKDLLRAYVLDGLGDEVKLERARICKAMLSDTRTAKAWDMATLAKRCDVPITTLENHLIHMGSLGLMRCLNEQEPQIGRRTWQIAHDFIASLIEKVVSGVYRTVWRVVRPWLAPATMVLAGALIVSSIPSAEERAKAELEAAGLTWNASTRTITVDRESHMKKVGDTTMVDSTIGTFITSARLVQLSPFFRTLEPTRVDLSKCDSLTNVDGLQGLGALQTLDLSSCWMLTNVDGIQGLGALQTLHLRFCLSLSNVDSLQGLGALQTLDLSECRTLSNVDGLQGLGALQTLDLSGCVRLTNVDGLQGLGALQTLNLRECRRLTNVDGLQGLGALQTLNLRECWRLTNVDGLQGLGALQTLDLGDCKSLTNVDGLQGLGALQTLDLSGCDSLTNADGLQGLGALQTLDLGYCKSLTNVDGLQGLGALETLDLGSCKSLTNVDGLQGLGALRTLDLSRCDSLTNVDSLQGLGALQTLDLTDCDGLTNVDGLRGLGALRTLDLSRCDSLTNVDGLQSLSALQTLNLSRCEQLINLFDATGLNRLKVLKLDGTKGIRSLTPLFECDSLRFVSVRRCCSALPQNELKELITLGVDTLASRVDSVRFSIHMQLHRARTEGPQFNEE
ncbi:MAG: hypothetical protein IPM12_06695 [Flavobacteriales bacterium]|nr:hypothetical protein [Flavobacteriales bacterium]